MSAKRRRLSRSAEFERVYRQGRSKGNRYLVLYAFPRAEDDTAEREDGPRLGLSVSRRVGGAVDRNRVKRVLREAFWAESERLPATSDYVVVARPDARELAEREGTAGMRGALSELVAGARRQGLSACAPLLLAPIRLYQRFVSPLLPRRCKYLPTCSDYAVQAVRTYGPAARLRARELAAAALQPVERRRLRPGLGPDAVQVAREQGLRRVAAQPHGVVRPAVLRIDLRRVGEHELRHAGLQRRDPLRVADGDDRLRGRLAVQPALLDP